MQVNLSLTPGYRLKISRAFRMSELVDRAITGLAALGGSAAFSSIHIHRDDDLAFRQYVRELEKPRHLLLRHASVEDCESSRDL